MSRGGRMTVPFAVAGKRGGPAVLVEELDPVETEVEQVPDVPGRFVLRARGRRAAHVAGPPVTVPVLAPRRAVGETADRVFAPLALVVIAAFVAGPLVPDHPPHTVA